MRSSSVCTSAKLYKGDKGDGGRSYTGLNMPKPVEPSPPGTPTTPAPGLPEIYPAKPKDPRPESDGEGPEHGNDDSHSVASEASDASPAGSMDAASVLPACAVPPSVASSSPARTLPKHASKVAKRPRLTAAQQHMHGLTGEEQDYEMGLARLETFLRRRRKCLDDFMPPRPTLKLPGTSNCGNMSL